MEQISLPSTKTIPAPKAQAQKVNHAAVMLWIESVDRYRERMKKDARHSTTGAQARQPEGI